MRAVELKWDWVGHLARKQLSNGGKCYSPPCLICIVNRCQGKDVGVSL